MSSLESVHHQNGQYQAHKVSDEARIEIHLAGFVFLAAVNKKMMRKCVLHVFFRQYNAKEVLDNTAVKLLLFQFDTTHKHNVAMTKYTVQISDTTNYSSSFHHTQTFL